MPNRFHLSLLEEKAIYDLHENSLDDAGYLTFLSRAITPLKSYLTNKRKSEVKGLDYGCGPAPALANQLQNDGYSVDVYDPIYAPNQAILNSQYDFVSCTEVVEHFNNPKPALETLFNLVKPQGVLVIMTKLVINQERFAQWHYKNDLTHVAFYCEQTFEYIAENYGFTVEISGNDVLILTKK